MCCVHLRVRRVWSTIVLVADLRFAKELVKCLNMALIHVRFGAHVGLTFPTIQVALMHAADTLRVFSVDNSSLLLRTVVV